MIKGTDIVLYTDNTPETVHNVLIGEPSSGGFTLAIPKGDEHEWTDRIAEFFGRKYRTVGLPEQGIEANIPGAWHKKVRAELMKICGNCTVYENNTYTKHEYRDVFYCDERGIVTLKNGIQTAGVLNIIIYSASGGAVDYIPKQGDIVVCGDCDFDFDMTSQQTISESMTEFRELYPKFGAISSVSHEICGTRPDYIITAR